MPIYDYRCKDCNNHFDVFHKGKEMIEDILCPKCGSKNYTKLISAPSISFSNSSSEFNDSCSCDSNDCCCGSCGMN